MKYNEFVGFLGCVSTLGIKSFEDEQFEEEEEGRLKRGFGLSSYN